MTIKVYGEEGKNGVIEIETKKQAAIKSKIRNEEAPLDGKPILVVIDSTYVTCSD